MAEQLVVRGHSVLFATCSLLVQDLLASKRDLRLERYLKKLAGFEALVIDDLGYVQQSREGMAVLLTLLTERYEQGSVLLTSNLRIDSRFLVPKAYRCLIWMLPILGGE